jgi:hypothetical protein
MKREGKRREALKRRAERRGEQVLEFHQFVSLAFDVT